MNMNMDALFNPSQLAGLGQITRQITQLADSLNMDKLQAKLAEVEVVKQAQAEVTQESTTILPPPLYDSATGSVLASSAPPSRPPLAPSLSLPPPPSSSYAPFSYAGGAAAAAAAAAPPPLPAPAGPPPPPARTADPTMAADAAFLEDMVSVGVDPTAPPPVLPPPLPRTCRTCPHPGGMGARITARPAP